MNKKNCLRKQKTADFPCKFYQPISACTVSLFYECKYCLILQLTLGKIQMCNSLWEWEYTQRKMHYKIVLDKLF